MFTGVTVKELARLAGPLIGDGLVKRSVLPAACSARRSPCL